MSSDDGRVLIKNIRISWIILVIVAILHLRFQARLIELSLERVVVETDASREQTLKTYNDDFKQEMLARIDELEGKVDKLIEKVDISKKDPIATEDLRSNRGRRGREGK